MKALARLLRIVVAFAAVACTPASFAGGTPWPDAPYNHFANHAKLETVLGEFAAGFGLSLALQPDVTGLVNGRFASRNPTEFLTKLGGAYGFVWYAHAGTLFVSRASDVVTRGIAAPGGNVTHMRKALADLGVLEPRFGWGELTDSGVAMVSGPPSYVQLIDSTIRNLPARSHQLKVFRLHHASAEDRTVQYRDQQMKIPGLASILRNMVASGALSSTAPAQLGGGVGAPLRAAGSTSADGTSEAGASAAATAPAIAPAPQARGPKPTVEAEPRLNAIIVQDVPERMPLYQQVIEQLDVATPQIEIEAMIIDISSQRASELGVNWSGRVGTVNFGFGQPVDPGAGGTASFTSGSTAAGNYLMAQLHALQTRGDAEIQSRPSVLTSDNLAALVDLSETFYISTQGERVATVTPVTAGTTLRVTPHMVQDNGRTLVQLKIDIQDGEITDRKVGALPTVTNSSVSTEATVQQGEALLIAGHSSRRDITQKQQLPLVGDVPVLGLLFSNKTRNVEKRDRLFLIRPRVVGADPVPMAQAASAPASAPAPAIAASTAATPVPDSRGELRYPELALLKAEPPAAPATPVAPQAVEPAPVLVDTRGELRYPWLAWAVAPQPAAPPPPAAPAPVLEEVTRPFRKDPALPVKPYRPAPSNEPQKVQP